jgi:hypothetical protein
LLLLFLQVEKHQFCMYYKQLFCYEGLTTQNSLTSTVKRWCTRALEKAHKVKSTSAKNLCFFCVERKQKHSWAFNGHSEGSLLLVHQPEEKQNANWACCTLARQREAKFNESRSQRARIEAISTCCNVQIDRQRVYKLSWHLIYIICARAGPHRRREHFRDLTAASTASIPRSLLGPAIRLATTEIAERALPSGLISEAAARQTQKTPCFVWRNGKGA